MSAWGKSFGAAWGNSWGGSSTNLLASLGSDSYQERISKRSENDGLIEEALSDSTISRIQNEFLSESLAHDLITRARKRKARAEEEAILLIL